MQSEYGKESLSKSKILLLGPRPKAATQIDVEKNLNSIEEISKVIDQTFIFSDTLTGLLENRGYRRSRLENEKQKKRYYWIDPTRFTGDNKPTVEQFQAQLKLADCVILVKDDPMFDLDLIKSNSKILVDCRAHEYEILADKSNPAGLTAWEKKKNDPESVQISAIYTGIVPIVYKAQNQLLISLIKSIGLAFCMIL